MEISRQLAEFVIDNKFQDFDAETVKFTKNLCLSEIGMCLGGTKIPDGEAAINYVKEYGAPAEAGVFGAGLRTSPELAAMANGTTSHATEFEDVGFPETMYTCGIFPAGFALAEKYKLSGKELIQLNILGYEVGSALSVNGLTASMRGFQIASVYATIGVAAMAAKVLKLGINETMMALSLSASAACGLQKQTGTGAHVYEAGVIGMNGIMAAKLAKHGLTGRKDIFEIEGGFMEAFAGVSDPKAEFQKYYINNVGYKRFPCCIMQQNIIAEVKALVSDNKLSAEDLDYVQLDAFPGLLRVVPVIHPEDQAEAHFSIPHSIAACFLNKEIGLECYTTETAKDPMYHALREKVKIVVHPEWEKTGLSGAPIPILVKLKDGRELKVTCASSDKPFIFGDQELVDRYVEHASLALSRNQAEQSAKMIMALEELSDVTELMNTITFPEKN
jgi:2-methylcitrate dehydratase PrpD